MKPARLILADDQAMVRTGFRMVLTPQRDFDVVAEAADGQQACELAELLRPDIVVMDVRMPRLDGIEATRRIIQCVPTTRVLVLTTFDLDEYVVSALNAGASGFLLKDAGAPELLAAVRAVHAGDSVVAPAATRRLLERLLPLENSHTPVDLRALSARELEVLTLIAKGQSNSEIADSLFLAESTVKTHINRILSKLRARDRVQLVIIAYETGLIRPGS
ncbi:Nitrogen regulation protein C [Dermatophilus congolensis]|uniref:Nitrogen regulation protein C n=1 Tax=Dermatophilus congolensis TaxID=1863 RepID=A0A239VJZ5_9MICO|nr:response regulator transcription factor [Dermatophilus congolensis]SNV21908.1 Nitrogen regulation protein C [Dermatophilus congolensis]